MLVGSSRRTTYTDYAKGYEIRETASTVENLRYRTDSYDFYDVPRKGTRTLGAAVATAPRRFRSVCST